MPSDTRLSPTDSDESPLFFIVINFRPLSLPFSDLSLSVFRPPSTQSLSAVGKTLKKCSILFHCVPCRSKKLHFSNGSLLTIPTSPGIPLWDKVPVVEARNVLHHPW